VEKRVPLLPVTTDEQITGEDLTPSLHELLSEDQEEQYEPPEQPASQNEMEEPPAIPSRPTRRSASIHEDVEVPVVPRRPSRKLSTDSQQTPSPEEPIIPPRPVRTASIKSEKSFDEAVSPLTMSGNMQSIPAIQQDVPEQVEPIIPPRPRRSSIKSIPEPQEAEEIDKPPAEPVIPPRPQRKSSIKSATSHETISPEIVPIIPHRPSRKSSVKSFQSHHSIEEESVELEKTPSAVSSIKSAKSIEPLPEKEEPISTSPELAAEPTTQEIPVILEPSKTESKEVESTPIDEPKETAPPIEEIPTSPHQHPILPVRPTKQEPIISPPHQADPEPTPIIPTRPQKPTEQEHRLAGIAALTTSTPLIPPRPKPKSKSDTPRPQIITEPTERRASSISPRPQDASTEMQSDLPVKKPAPTIPARPQHKLASKFEAAAREKEKPAIPPRPAVKPVLAGGGNSKFAGLRAQFAKDLNERLAKPAPALPARKEEVHSMQSGEVKEKSGNGDVVEEGSSAGSTEKGGGEGKVNEMRKGRARGPQRRPPTVKPIVPDGWGVSIISTVFEQRHVEEKEKQKLPEVQEEKVERDVQTGEKVIESPEGVKTVYVEGAIDSTGQTFTHVVAHDVEPEVDVATEKGEELPPPGQSAPPPEIMTEDGGVRDAREEGASVTPKEETGEELKEIGSAPVVEGESHDESISNDVEEAIGEVV